MDYWLSNFKIGKAKVRDERISDHKIVTTLVNFGETFDSDYLRFTQSKIYKCPAWIGSKKWHSLFEEAFKLGERLQWEEAIHMVEELDWPADVGQQDLINFQWAMVCAKPSWSFSVAAGYALALLPDSYSNLKEVQFVVDLANHRKIKGFSNHLQKRTLQKTVERRSEAMRKLYKKAGRLTELLRRKRSGKFDSETFSLFKKLYPDLLFSEVGIEAIAEDLDSIRDIIEKKESSEKAHNIDAWKKRMQNSVKRQRELAQQTRAIALPYGIL